MFDVDIYLTGDSDPYVFRDVSKEKVDTILSDITREGETPWVCIEGDVEKAFFNKSNISLIAVRDREANQSCQ